MVCLMLRSVWPLLIESALILLQTVPAHIDIEELKRKLLQQCDGVLAVHEFHIWQLAGDRIIASAHIRCLNLSEYMKVSGTSKFKRSRRKTLPLSGQYFLHEAPNLYSLHMNQRNLSSTTYSSFFTISLAFIILKYVNPDLSWCVIVKVRKN